MENALTRRSVSLGDALLATTGGRPAGCGERDEQSSGLPPLRTAFVAQQAVADVFAQQGLLSKRIDVRDLWDDRFNGTVREKV